MTLVTLLEPRRLFASVFQGIPGYYEITGTPGDDSIVVSINQAAQTFSLDGNTYSGVLHVSVDAGAGDDTVTISSAGTGSISAAVHGGTGRDTLSLNTAGGLWGDDGNDTLTVRDDPRGEAWGGPGDDQISVAGESPGAVLQGDDGNDVLWALDDHYAVSLFGGAGNDRLYGSPYNDVIYDGPGSDYVFGLAGDDEFHTRDAQLDWIMGGDGNDTLYCDYTEGGINSVETIFYG